MPDDEARVRCNGHRCCNRHHACRHKSPHRPISTYEGTMCTHSALCGAIGADTICQQVFTISYSGAGLADNE